MCEYHHKGNFVEKRFESTWHNQVAPDPGEDWSGATALPEATVAKDLVKSFQDSIKQGKEKFSERPPGRWQSKGGNDDDEEKSAEKEAALWSAANAAKDLELEFTHTKDRNQTLTMKVSNELTVRQLKEAIVERVGRGPASSIVLAAGMVGTLNDETSLSSLEEDLADGLSLSGVDLGPPREVKIRIVHATSSTQSLELTVLDTLTVIGIRKKVKATLEEKMLSRCKLVKKVFDSFTNLKDDDHLNGKVELLFLGRDLPEEGAVAQAPTPAVASAAVDTHEPILFQPTGTPLAPGQEHTLVLCLDRDMDIRIDVVVPGGVTVRNVKEKVVADDPTGCTTLEDFTLNLPGSNEPLSETSVLTTAMFELDIRPV